MEFNKATLSGSMDVIVVKQPDGSLKSTPFFCRFGKKKVMRPTDKLVQVYINDSETPIKMKLGSQGEGIMCSEGEAPLEDQKEEEEEKQPVEEEKEGL